MAFDPPLGSTSPAVLLDNATRLDELVNGPAGTVTDRSGQPLDTWRLMLQTFAAIVENTRENLVPLGKQYTDLSKAQADIANIPDGAVIYVLSPLSD
nr:SGNH/GDSL hydrolase family protein [Klebsiella pneumoniae]